MMSWKVLGITALTGAVLLGGPGCIKMKKVITIYPDGSGKVVSEARSEMDLIGTMMDLLEFLVEEEGEEEGAAEKRKEEIQKKLDKQLFENVADQSKGLVAWTIPTYEKAEDSDEGGLMKFTGYFEDINKLVFTQGEPAGGAEYYAFKKLEDGSFEVEVGLKTGNTPMAGPEGPVTEEKMEEARKELKSTMGVFLEGIEFAFIFRLPGEVTEVEGMEVDGREATFSMDMDKLIDLVLESRKDPEKAKAKEVVLGKVTCKPGGDLSEEMAAFQEEMEQAKADWEKAKAELAQVEGLMEEDEEEEKEEESREEPDEKEMSPPASAPTRLP